MADDDIDKLLVTKIRSGDATCWEQLIARYEKRLLAFAQSRVRNKTASEDIVQEAFMGFLMSLPNYDDQSTPLESWLFTITAHKLTDYLRKEGRRPTIPLIVNTDETGRGYEPAGKMRPASSLMRSGERKTGERKIVEECLRGLIEQWKERGEYERLCCMELLFVLGWTNKATAKFLKISEQAVANHKQFVVGKLKDAASRAHVTNFNLSEYGI
ncbi:MAG: sigma-70 family RNA polymerase sigma factor [Planctomycetaceae bacterium]